MSLLSKPSTFIKLYLLLLVFFFIWIINIVYFVQTGLNQPMMKALLLTVLHSQKDLSQHCMNLLIAFQKAKQVGVKPLYTCYSVFNVIPVNAAAGLLL